MWAAGHFLTFFAGLRYLITAATFSTAGYEIWYRVAFYGAIISYGVVIYKSFGVPRTDKAYVQRALMDENVQYLVVAIYWCYIKPISSTSAPLTSHAYSLHHLFAVPSADVYAHDGAAGFARLRRHRHAEQLGPVQDDPVVYVLVTDAGVKDNYDRAMRFVSYAEVAIFVRVLLGALFFRNSLLAPLLYAHFLRLRFYMSSFTRAAFQHVRSELDSLTQNPSCPQVVRNGYLMLTDLVTRYASTVLSINKDQPTTRATPQSSTPADPTKVKTR